MKTLHETLQDYLAIRRGLGFKFQHQERRLSSFISFLEQRGAAYITVQLALEWATQPPDRQPSWALRLTDVRGFARYLRSTDPRTEVPPTGLLAFGGRITPYLYSQEEIRRLLAAAKKLPPSGGLRRWTYHCLFGLLAVTGLRISEALALEREDVDLDEGLLTIRDTKFGKTRLVALHESTQSMMTDYAERRDAHLGALRSPYFLVAEQGGRVWAQHVYPVFHQLSRQIGLRGPSDHTGPRLHDFRHRFAVQILLRGYQTEQDINLLLPILSTWLGHSCVRDTYWYLSACPELMQQVVGQLERRWEGQS